LNKYWCKTAKKIYSKLKQGKRQETSWTNSILQQITQDFEVLLIFIFEKKLVAKRKREGISSKTQPKHQKESI
jgi:hypothetical protein